MPLPAGSKAKIEVEGITFQISTVNAGRAVAGHFQLDTQGLLYHGLSMAVHLGMLGAQLAVIISTFAMAARQRNLLWSLAAIAGLIAVAFAIYVYLKL